jgi:hypothetical protein
MTSGLAAALALLFAMPPLAARARAPRPVPGPDAAEPEEGSDDAEVSDEADEPEAETGVPEGDVDDPDADAEPDADLDADASEPDATDPPPVPTVPDEPLPDTEPGDDDALDDDALDDEPFVDDYDPLRDSPEAVEARRLITGGIILISAGTVLAVGSLAIGVTDKCTRAAGNSCSGAARDRAAVTMAIPAVAIFAAGAALLGVGIRNRNRLRASVAFGRDGGGLLVTGRF